MTSRMVSLKNVLRYFFLLTIFLFQSPALQAHIGIQIIDVDDDGGNHQFQPSPIDGCNFSFSIPLYIANLVKTVDESNGVQNNLPPGVEDIYIHYSIGDDSGVLLVDISQAVYQFDYDGEPIFYYHQPLTTSFYDECHGSNIGESLHLSWSLRTANGDLYPLEDHAEPGEVFSCMVFRETCGYCNDDCEFSPSSPEWGRSLWIECCTCNKNLTCYGGISTPKDTIPKDSTLRSVLPNASLLAERVTFSAKPNPFQSNLTLDISLPDQTNFGVQIYNASGQLILQHDAISSSDWYQTTIDTDNWPRGIYYVKINSPYGQKTEKLVKTY